MLVIYANRGKYWSQTALGIAITGRAVGWEWGPLDAILFRYVVSVGLKCV